MLLFDGECALCQRIVRLLLRFDRNELLRFAPLQGVTGQAFLRAHGRPTGDFDSLIFVPDWSRHECDEFLQRTDGALAALRSCGGWGDELAAVLGIWPRRWRDAGYRAIARSRHRIFGPQSASLPLPSGSSARFLP